MSERQEVFVSDRLVQMWDPADLSPVKVLQVLRARGCTGVHHSDLLPDTIFFGTRGDIARIRKQVWFRSEWYMVSEARNKKRI